VDALERRVAISRAVLPETVDWVRISNLVVGDAAVDLHLERHAHDVGVTVLHRRGDVQILAVK
jgi:hypothetical protein